MHFILSCIPLRIIDEDIGNMGVIGNRNEPLLNAAINNIVGISAKPDVIKTFDYETIGGSRMNRLFVTDVLETRPEIKEAMKKMRDKK